MSYQMRGAQVAASSQQSRSQSALVWWLWLRIRPCRAIQVNNFALRSFRVPHPVPNPPPIPPSMPRPCPIALTGLTPTEQVLLEGALFQSAGNQLPGAVLEKNLERALLIIANADDADGVRALRARLPGARVLLVGTSDQGTTALQLARSSDSKSSA